MPIIKRLMTATHFYTTDQTHTHTHRQRDKTALNTDATSAMQEPCEAQLHKETARSFVLLRNIFMHRKPPK